VFQIGALPIVVLAPLGGISLLWNSLLAHVILGEGFTQAMMLGTVLIATGAVLIAIFGVVPDDNHTLDELLALWKRGPFLAFFSVVCVAVVLVLAAAHLTAWRVRSADHIRLPDNDDEALSNYASPRSIPPIPFRPTSTHLSTVANSDGEISPISPIHPLDTKVVRFAGVDELAYPLARLDRRQRTLTLCGLAFAAASGTLSGLCLVLAKAAIELVIATIDHWRTGRGGNEFARVETWFIVAGLGIAAILQLVYLNYSLAFASPALICPLAFCFYNLASIFDGLIFYDQFGRLATHQIVLMSIGVAVLLVGVWVVSAIQPTGDGGIEVGTWVEEEQLATDPEALDELEAADGATLLDGDEVSEPEAIPDSPLDGPTHGPGGSPGALSPTRRRRPRYGTLIPDLGGAGVPTGFAFGIGAASPGFALRSASTTPGRRNTFSHSRSRSTSAVPRRRSEEDLSPQLAGLPSITDDLPSLTQRRRPARLSLPPSSVARQPVSSAPPTLEVEDALAAWEAERARSHPRLDETEEGDEPTSPRTTGWLARIWKAGRQPIQL
jgi:hypothetical protein